MPCRLCFAFKRFQRLSPPPSTYIEERDWRWDMMSSSNSHMQRANQKPPSPSYSSTEMSMANSACSGELRSPSEDNSWASDIADFVATQQKDATSSSSSSSLVVCKKPSSRKRKIATEDDPLEDTACSSSAEPRKARKRRETGRTTCNIQSQVDAGLAKIGDVGINKVDGAVMKSPNDSGEKLTDLRKKGLCLVPLSMLIDFLQ